MTKPASWTDADLAKVAHLKEAHDKIIQQIRKAVVGQEQVVKELMIVLFAQGHGLLMGVPGLAKTLLVRTLASSLSLQFRRVQFTPDLMPSDITGTEVIQEDKATGERRFKFLQGPIFTNMLLADEINRTPPKTQAALLEAMQEIQVTAGGERYDLPRPFMVLATQNPIEQEGTYPLPEAQLDRFMFQINVDYPNKDEELQVLDLTTTNYKPEIVPVLGAEEILPLQALVRKVIVSQELKEYVVRLVRATRPGREGAPEFVGKWVSWGAGPRASQNLVLGAKAWAILNGRHEATPADVRFVASPVLGHRLVTNFAAEAEGINPTKVVQQLLETVK
ncbi:AAA family ATPase [Planctomycetaceae bacterium SCGC AG-212-F19]|nr:AAA family ATPase [Planctomycetaceae bacterium SCGC AG-212-F19]